MSGHDRRLRRMGVVLSDHRQIVSSGSPASSSSATAEPCGSATASSSRAPLLSGPTGSVDPEPDVQARRCFEIIEAALREAGGDAARRRAHADLPHRCGRLRRDRRGARRALRRDTTCQHDVRREGAARSRVEGRDRGRGGRGDAGVNHGRPRRRGRRPRGHRWTTNGARSPGGWVAVTDGFVSGDRRSRRRAARGADGPATPTGCLVTPGLVNTHHHIYQNLTAGLPAGDVGIALRLAARRCTRVWSRLDEEAAYVSAWIGLAELALGGCTTSTDHLYVHPARWRRPDQRRDHAPRASWACGSTRPAVR